ncbi:MAG: sigma-70 family RNA polymerase sigma factor [Ruminococcaceae bacterium]|nr:sigma-70 family RNA polymerase sigma factor [Oscillospiraceae bacterium]
MDDDKIVAMYFERNEEAIRETDLKYGKYCFYIAQNILCQREDSKECVSDTYVRAWNAIPPHRPSRLGAFLGRITRNLALDRYAYHKAEKRLDNTSLVYEELSECIPDANGRMSVEDEVALKMAVDSFLAGLERQKRILFLRRYWYLSPIKELARDFSMSESNVKITLHRIRMQFKEHLEQQGIEF